VDTSTFVVSENQAEIGVPSGKVSFGCWLHDIIIKPGKTSRKTGTYRKYLLLTRFIIVVYFDIFFGFSYKSIKILRGLELIFGLLSYNK
jgi:hypothetical protein